MTIWLVKTNGMKLTYRNQVEITPEELELLKNHLEWNDVSPLLAKRLGTLEQRRELLKKLEEIL